MSEKYWTAEDLAAHGYYLSADQEDQEDESPGVYEISNAQAPLSSRVDKRAKNYVLKMAIRVVCIVGAVLTDGFLRWGFVVGAALLPWAAVVIANGESKQHAGGFTAYLPDHQQQALETGSGSGSAASYDEGAHTSSQETNLGHDEAGSRRFSSRDSAFDRADVIDVSDE